MVSLTLGLGVTEVRRRGVVPHAARRFLAIIFALDDRQARDLAATLSADADVHELGGDGVGATVRVGAAAVRIVTVHQAAQFRGVRARHLLVAAFPNKNGGMVAVVYQHVAEICHAQRPRAAAGVALAVATGLDSDEAELVARDDLGRAARHVTPADKVAAGVLHQLHRVGLQPIG